MASYLSEGQNDLLEADSVTTWLNDDFDLIIESGVIESACPHEYWVLSLDDDDATYGSPGESSFLLTAETPTIASSKDIKEFLGRPGSLSVVRSAMNLAEKLFLNVPADKAVATVALSVSSFLGIGNVDSEAIQQKARRQASSLCRHPRLCLC